MSGAVFQTQVSFFFFSEISSNIYTGRTRPHQYGEEVPVSVPCPEPLQRVAFRNTADIPGTPEPSPGHPCFPASPHPASQSLALEGKLDRPSHGDAQRSHTTPQDHTALQAEPGGESDPSRTSRPRLFPFPSPPVGHETCSPTPSNPQSFCLAPGQGQQSAGPQLLEVWGLAVWRPPPTHTHTGWNVIQAESR